MTDIKIIHIFSANRMTKRYKPETQKTYANQNLQFSFPRSASTQKINHSHYMQFVTKQKKNPQDHE